MGKYVEYMPSGASASVTKRVRAIENGYICTEEVYTEGKGFVSREYFSEKPPSLELLSPPEPRKASVREAAKAIDGAGAATTTNDGRRV